MTIHVYFCDSPYGKDIHSPKVGIDLLGWQLLYVFKNRAVLVTVTVLLGCVHIPFCVSRVIQGP